MDSKKLGMFAAAAALTIATAQANADAKAPAKTKGGDMVCASSGCGNNCKGKEIDAKDKTSCDTAKGNWVTRAEFEKNKPKKTEEAAPAADGKKTDAHKH